MLNRRAGVLALTLFSLGIGTASAQSVPSPSPSTTPTPPGTFALHLDAHTTFISQGTSGPGQSPPEGPSFAAGSPLSPLSPYDTLSSAPLTPGNAGTATLYLRAAYSGKGAFDFGATLGAGYVRGSVTNAVYWDESLVPALNPHLGAQGLPYRITFPTHAGQDDGTGVNVGLVTGTIATKDGNASMRAGWFDLLQTDTFVFAQPAIPNAVPAIGLTSAETLGDGAPNLASWTPAAATLPLHGIDFFGKHGLATLELTSAALPSLPGTSARMNQASVVVDHGEGTRYSAQLLHVATGGDLVSTTILYGGDPNLFTTPQGPLPISSIGGQQQTIFGLRAAFHALRGLDAVTEFGHSTYAATHVAVPGTSRPGDYYHAGLTHPFGRAAVTLDYYRNDARYANILLPYGATENVWSVAWAWPGQWLKSNYQLINDFPVNIDRQGYRLKYTLGSGPLDIRAIYANFAEIDPITYSNAFQTGFIDGFFLPQADANATLGRQHQYGLYLGWHPAFGDLTVDYAEDTMRRRAVPNAPQDLVSYDAPELVISFAHHFSQRALASIGVARYAMRGSFGQAYTNIDYAQRIGIAGLEYAESTRTTTLVSARRSAFSGQPSFLGGPSPNFTGTLFVLEQRYKI